MPQPKKKYPPAFVEQRPVPTPPETAEDAARLAKMNELTDPQKYLEHLHEEAWRILRVEMGNPAEGTKIEPEKLTRSGREAYHLITDSRRAAAALQRNDARDAVYWTIQAMQRLKWLTLFDYEELISRGATDKKARSKPRISKEDPNVLTALDEAKKRNTPKRSLTSVAAALVEGLDPSGAQGAWPKTKQRVRRVLKKKETAS